MASSSSIASRASSEVQRQEAAEFIKAETLRLDRTIRQFLAYARPNPPELRENDLNEIVDYSLEIYLAREGRPPNLRIVKQLAERLPPCWLDAAQIHQVLLNLLLNAQEALEEEGIIEVSTGREDDWLVLTVADSGPGVDPAQADRIFDPFYTTKPEGAGLGLAVVHRIITEHRGRLKVEKSHLGGAAVRVLLPEHPAERPIPVEFDTSVLPLGAAMQGALRRRNAVERRNDVRSKDSDRR
jgi:signal transduction histidine kinase